MTDMPLVSVVVTSYDVARLGDLIELLESLKKQTYPDIEVVFVAERSRELHDRVKAILGGDESLSTTVCFNDGEEGMSAARNVGISHSRGSIISFIDDDAVPYPDWAERIVRAFEDESVIAVTGPAVPLWEDPAMAWIPEEFYWVIGCTAWCGWEEPRTVRNIWGMNMAFRREAFEAAGTFSTNMGAVQGKRLHGEENEISLRIARMTKRRILFHPDIVVRHKVGRNRLTARYVAQSSYWIGRTRRIMKALFPGGSAGEDVLNTERELLKRMVTHLFPGMLAGLGRHPVATWRKSRLAVIALSSVALGYLTCRTEGSGPTHK